MASVTPIQGQPCRVRWAGPDGAEVMCEGVFLAAVPAVDIPQRYLVRSKTPRGGTTLAEVHPDSVVFDEVVS